MYLEEEYYDSQNNTLYAMNSSMTLLYIEGEEYMPSCSILAENEKVDFFMNFVTYQKPIIHKIKDHSDEFFYPVCFFLSIISSKYINKIYCLILFYLTVMNICRDLTINPIRSKNSNKISIK